MGDDDDIKYFSWDIDNKYYSAKVVLCATEKLPLGMPVDGVEAVILHYEPKAILLFKNPKGLSNNYFYH